MQYETKNILFVTSFTPPINAGGEKNAFNFAIFLARKGHAITLLSFNRKGRLKKNEVIEKVNVSRILYFNHNLLTKLFSLFLIVPNYLFYISKNEIIFIYGGNIIAFELIILIGKLLNKKVIFQSLLMEEDDINTLIYKRFGGKLRKIILNLIDVYSSFNPVFTKIWKDIYKYDLKVIELAQPVNTSIFYNMGKKKIRILKQKLGIPINKFIIITVGYLIKRKGFQEIFEILAKLDIPYFYIVVGDHEVSKDHYMVNFNHEMNYLYEKGLLLLGKNILFTGPKTNINEYLNIADVFLFNSIMEGFPTNAVLESMACGVPCIAKDIIGSNNNITKNNFNILLAKDSSETLKYLYELFYNPTLRIKIGKNALETIQKKASLEVVYNKLFRKLL